MRKSITMPLSICLNCGDHVRHKDVNVVQIGELVSTIHRRPTWKCSYKEACSDNLDIHRLQEICNLRDELSTVNISQYDINNIYDEIKTILHNSATEFGSINVKKHGKVSQAKVKRKRCNFWWNEE